MTYHRVPCDNPFPLHPLPQVMPTATLLDEYTIQPTQAKPLLFDAPSFFDCSQSAELIAELYKGRMCHVMYDLAMKHAQDGTKIKVGSHKGERSVTAVSKIGRRGAL